MDYWITFLGVFIGVLVFDVFVHKREIRKAKEEILALIIKEDLVFIIENHAKLRDPEEN